jgi:hypothetical protein
MIVCPKYFSALAVSILVVKSAEPPAENGTMMVTGFFGKSTLFCSLAGSVVFVLPEVFELPEPEAEHAVSDATAIINASISDTIFLPLDINIIYLP